MNQYVFSYLSPSVTSEISESLSLFFKNRYPVIICVGSDLCIGDSLGPLTGTRLIKSLKGKVYVYGTLKNTVTAKEINIISKNVKKIHPSSKVIVIDAAVGKSEDIGKIKVSDRGIRPGLGVNKFLDEIGDVSIISIVAEKEKSLISSGEIRLSLIDRISGIIADAVTGFLK